jgi:hypothetical protein
MSYHKALGAPFEDFSNNQTSLRKAPMVLLKSSPFIHKRFHSDFSKFMFLLTFHQTPCVQLIFFLLMISTSRDLLDFLNQCSKGNAPFRILFCHLVFHSLHYHFFIGGHLLFFLIVFLAIIKSVTIWSLSYTLLLTLLTFKINSVDVILSSISLLLDLVYPFMQLLVHFEAWHPIM